MNTQAHRMAQDLIHDLESLIAQTERNAMLGRKLADDEKYSDEIDHSNMLNTLEIANKHLKLAKALLSEVDDAARKENPRD